MAWEIFIFKANETIEDYDSFDDSKLLEVDFVSQLEAYFPNIERDDTFHSIQGDTFAIQYFTSPEDPLQAILIVELRGEKALFELGKVALKEDWQLYDSALGKMLDLQQLSENGYQVFRAYLRQIMNGQQ